MPPVGVFLASLQRDALAFIQWIAGQWPLQTPAPTPELVGALHLDLKLWQPEKALAKNYRVNDAHGNALKVLYWFSVKRRFAEKAYALLPRVVVDG
jgi:hypothetical protein